MMIKKNISLVLAAALTLATVAGCNAQAENNAGSDTSGDIILDGEKITSSSSGVQIDGSNAVITQAGSYTISGKLSDGQLAVNVPNGDSVTLILNNANITCRDNSPLYIEEAGDVTIMLPGDTKNSLTDGLTYKLDTGETEPDATVFSNSDLTIEGEGTLTVDAYYNDGIASRDTLYIKGGIINVNSANHAIKGKDYLMIDGGTIAVDAVGDGLKATNDTQAEMGYVKINGGNISIKAKDEGISGVSMVVVSGGAVQIASNKTGIKSNNSIDLQGGEISIQTSDEALSCLEQTGTDNATLTVNGETIAVN